jgi:hypothetical protein
MKIGGHGIREHLRLFAPLFALIAAVWALRMVADYGGASMRIVRLASVTVAGSISILLAVILVHVRKFGGYANVAAVAFMLALWEQLLISSAVAFTALTGLQTIYAAPEFSGPPGRHLGPWQHIFGQFTFVLGFQTLGGAVMGCLILWILRVLFPPATEGK